ncbi:UDP-N-acetylmuramoyl-tripeptide--D-alanyl-D-alanine ligase [Desulforamulus hydrothermalis]|uniref:UDP-N-acetylmuramoyl-tripeptide--D-alanyl-D-alanine ligase n=1 Tax=Desulforamulus hydrothermalis Lam5 = DSM 18033 TaxID=1121428 RepID=K8EJG3_9FIRM|nr:UDP-N-acetylmuramoyl-tripeptide--D-alanyl-D-alanine ligase [Desulforamulus hydrothermalis]CCO08721.1 UDP-N-acetylmuramoyl-tripeptide--D-alanyl-D-alanine ligase [Desulforamulus hydrothermalis Lam5 = DSM 18033]SHG69972.1 UDP-N-acetylmuramoyl-tripeptide--D-alanyl-D-alanine ligase [Desulforamulus hydrothermalis Lam5 = DSM 18033]
MLPYSVDEIARITGGVLLQGNPATPVNGVCIDSRQVQPGGIFAALPGQQVDGHDFAAQAVAGGAAALLVSRPVTVAAAVPVVLVKDTRQALQRLAADNRARLTVPVVAVTGSNGKTTTKDMIASVLQTRYNTLKTQGNYNNELGLPLTLLNLTEQHQAAVVEMGMRGPGEIDFLAKLAKPTGAVITNIGEAHLERLGSVKNIALAKTEVLEHIEPGGFAVLNGDSPWLKELADRCRGKVWFYSLTGRGDIRGYNIEPDGLGVKYQVIYPGGRGEIYLPVPGSHNVLNSLAAVGVGLQLGLTFADIACGLQQAALSGMRLEIIKCQGITIINDTYNANPASVKAALKVLQETATGRKIAVLGNMYELGALSQTGHREVGEAAAGVPVDYLVTVGQLARWIAEGGQQAGLPSACIRQCADNPQAVSIIKNILQTGDTILIKGSRGMRMEQIVQELAADGRS